MQSLFYVGLCLRPGPTADQRTRSFAHVWGEVEDDQGRKAISRLHGPEPGVVWTGRAALAAVRKVLANNAPPRFQTPALAYGVETGQALLRITGHGEPGGPWVPVGVRVHTGTAWVGSTVGASGAGSDFTALGDNVNIAVLI